MNISQVTFFINFMWRTGQNFLLRQNELWKVSSKRLLLTENFYILTNLLKNP